MQKTKNVSAGKWVALVIALLFMFATKYIPAPADLSQAGFQVLGILIGAIIPVSYTHLTLPTTPYV